MKHPPDVQAVIDAALAGGAAREVRVRADLLAGGAAPLARPEVQAAVSEKEFQGAVVGYAQGRGWKVAWVRPVRVQRRDGSVYHETPFGADGKGYSDTHMLRARRRVVAELKVGRNKPTREQLAWLAAEREAGAETFVWYPSDWTEILETLK